MQARNLVFAGTSVASGTGRGVVYGTGADTEFGHIYRLAGSVQTERSPLQQEVAVAARRVAIVAVLLGTAPARRCGCSPTRRSWTPSSTRWA